MARYPSALLTRAFAALLLVQLAAACGETSGTPPGNTELNVVIPNNGSQSPAPDGSPQPAAFDIEVVEYTIACNDGNTPGPFLDNNATFDDDVTISGALEVLDTASSGVTTQDFGPDLTEVYVWQGFMDLPPTAGCTVQLRARDADGEVICTSTETFDINADDETKVNVLMYCGISFQAPVGMLDLDGDFSFNVANFCPDLFVLNCVDPDLEELLVVPGTGAFVYSGCQVRFRDGDSSCGGTGIAPGDPDGASSCDPQVCVTTPEGLDCAPDPMAVDPPVTTTVTCDSPGFLCAIPGALFGTPCTPAPGDLCFDLSGGLACAPSAVLNCGGTTIDTACTFSGDTLGAIGDAPPAPLAVGAGGFLVGCTVADNDGDSLTPPVALAPGATVTCTAVTTDGDRARPRRHGHVHRGHHRWRHGLRQDQDGRGVVPRSYALSGLRRRRGMSGRVQHGVPSWHLQPRDLRWLHSRSVLRLRPRTRRTRGRLRSRGDRPCGLCGRCLHLAELQRAGRRYRL
jgi:hypothetical protein